MEFLNRPERKTRYQRAVEELEQRVIFPKSRPSLDRMQNGLERILPELQMDPNKIIVVAGTNGKGSICATLEALLLDAQQSVGLYTSPHIQDTRERIRINGVNISEDAFADDYEYIATRTADLNLTHFEILTLMAARIFYGTKTVEWTILEVGLGGRFDATNVIPHRNCVIATLGFDHENWLGSQLKDIAFNKFGIIHPGSTVVYSPLPEEAESVAQEVRLSVQSKWIPNIPFEMHVDSNGNEPVFFMETEFGRARLALPGHRAAQNSATALTVFRELGFNPALHLKALSGVTWPGRMERVKTDGMRFPVYFSGDHNPQGIKSLLEILPYYRRNKTYILVGVGIDKNLDGILEPLFSLPNTEIHLTETPFRGRSISQYGLWRNKACTTISDPREALREIFARASESDLILVTGSLYLVGFLKNYVDPCYDTLRPPCSLSNSS